MVRSAVGDDPDAERQWREKRLEQVALGRYGTPLDVAQCAVFLCSDESSYFTGAILHPDGGYVSAYGADRRAATRRDTSHRNRWFACLVQAHSDGENPPTTCSNRDRGVDDRGVRRG